MKRPRKTTYLDNSLSYIETQDLLELQELREYMQKLVDTENSGLKLSTKEIKAMFARHNEIFKLQEYGYFCSACIQTVYTRLKKILPTIEKELESRSNE